MHDVQEEQQPWNNLRATRQQPLVVVPLGDDEVQYFTSDEEADAAMNYDSVQQALDLAGAWSHLNGDEMLAALERMRHESPPTPPIDAI